MCKISKRLIISVCACICMVALETCQLEAKKEIVEFVKKDSSAVDVSSCRYTQQEVYKGDNPNLLSDLTGFEQKMETDQLVLYFNAETNGIRILNKKTGYVWGGLKEKKPENMNKSWSAMGNSMITIDYFDMNNQSSRISIGDESASTEYEWSRNRMVCKVDYVVLGISFTFELKLEDDNLEVTFFEDSIKETKANKLQSVWILPFFGCVEQDSIEGYMFIPDGSGALIRYDKSSCYVAAYDERIYGKDAGVDSFSSAGDLLAKRNNDYLVQTSNVSVPVYGSVHGANENAFMGVVESGGLYASIYASPAGIITDYSWSAVRFDYRNSYSFPVNKSGKSIITTQEEPEKFDCKIKFYFLDEEEANYSGMAVRYRELVKNGGLLENEERVEEEIPLYLHFLGADVKDSVLFKTYQKLTEVNDMSLIIDKLKNNNITNISVAYEGWKKGGLNGADYSQTKMDSRLGNSKDLEDLQNSLESQGGRFYLSFNPIAFNGEQARTASIAALTISNGYASYTRSNASLMYPTEYYAHPTDVVENISNVVKKYDFANFEIADIGNMVYGDYYRKHNLTRQETLDMFQGKMEQTKSKIALESPNEYMWNYTSEYLNMPMQNSQNLYETDSVPFLQIVLKGSIDYYAPYTNIGSYNQNNILRMIEYGAYPSFILMKEENEKLMDTPLSDYFSLNYDNWEEAILNVYAEVNDALKNVEGSTISNHIALAEGVACTSYDNGENIYVNYTNKEFITETGVTIPASGYLVTEE